MPFDTNNKYYPPDTFKTNIKRYISKCICSQTSSCTSKEHQKVLEQLPAIENDFYDSYKFLNNKQDFTFEEKNILIADDMKNYAIARVTDLLCELYNRRCQKSKKLAADEFYGEKTAKAIWKERCKEREKCPRGGIVLLSCEKPVNERIVLIKCNRNDCTNYGHSKGKIEVDETIQECSAREGSEELGLPRDYIYDQIKNNNHPIKKTVPYKLDGLTTCVEHYYFIIDVSFEDIHFELNEYEIDVSENDDSEKYANYYMVTCTNFTVASSLIWDILKFVDDKNGNKLASDKYKHIHRYCQRKLNEIILFNNQHQWWTTSDIACANKIYSLSLSFITHDWYGNTFF
ncbi:unnamed protein product [Rotaria sordida]|uniref:Nudix hydrolase domain-containing protein n=1 Tax=Rotaria sordida TaxID=392033 RepID=A0A816DDG6_9BILA|nr:unnamed protein product [Rotaria sordida]CAF1635869.1 unnamed protein product [Rotaria sordida]